MADMPKPAPIMTSRSVRLAMIACSPVVLAVILAELAIFVAMVRGRTPLEIGIGLMFGGVLVGGVTVLPMYLKIAEGWTRQDEAKINAAAPKAPIVQVATGDNSSATSTNIAAPAVSTTAEADGSKSATG